MSMDFAWGIKKERITRNLRDDGRLWGNRPARRLEKERITRDLRGHAALAAMLIPAVRRLRGRARTKTGGAA